jgi:hypothetical protein
MAQYKGSVVSATAVVDWHDIIASAGVADGESGELVIRLSAAGRVAVGVADPVASASAGVAVAANTAVKVILGSGAANQNVWVQSPASQASITVEVDSAGAKLIDAVYA